MRKRIIECVLATDMTMHNKEYAYIKLKKESNDVQKGKNAEKVFDNLDNITLYNTQQEFLNVLIHAADISNPTKPLGVYQKWVDLIMEEFWLQGDKEKDMKLPISFLCDRNTTRISVAQFGFISAIVLPLVDVMVEFFPGLIFIKQNADTNKEYYNRLKEDEDEGDKKQKI
jgi:hypothetical protein